MLYRYCESNSITIHVYRKDEQPLSFKIIDYKRHSDVISEISWGCESDKYWLLFLENGTADVLDEEVVVLAMTDYPV
jgi:hypothetical protein